MITIYNKYLVKAPIRVAVKNTDNTDFVITGEDKPIYKTTEAIIDLRDIYLIHRNTEDKFITAFTTSGDPTVVCADFQTFESIYINAKV